MRLFFIAFALLPASCIAPLVTECADDTWCLEDEVCEGGFCRFTGTADAKLYCAKLDKCGGEAPRTCVEDYSLWRSTSDPDSPLCDYLLRAEEEARQCIIDEQCADIANGACRGDEQRTERLYAEAERSVDCYTPVAPPSWTCATTRYADRDCDCECSNPPGEDVDCIANEVQCDDAEECNPFDEECSDGTG